MFDSLINLLYSLFTDFFECLTDLGINCSDFLSKSVFMENSLIGLNLTFNEFFYIVGIFVLLVLFVVVAFKFVGKIVYLFKP